MYQNNIKNFISLVGGSSKQNKKLNKITYGRRTIKFQNLYTGGMEYISDIKISGKDPKSTIIIFPGFSDSANQKQVDELADLHLLNFDIYVFKTSEIVPDEYLKFDNNMGDLSFRQLEKDIGNKSLVNQINQKILNNANVPDEIKDIYRSYNLTVFDDINHYHDKIYHLYRKIIAQQIFNNFNNLIATINPEGKQLYLMGNCGGSAMLLELISMVDFARHNINPNIVISAPAVTLDKLTELHNNFIQENIDKKIHYTWIHGDLTFGDASKKENFEQAISQFTNCNSPNIITREGEQNKSHLISKEFIKEFMSNNL